MDDEQPKRQLLNKRPQVPMPSTFQVHSDGTSLVVTFSGIDTTDYFVIFIMLLLVSPLVFVCLLSLLESTIATTVLAMLALAEAAFFYRMMVGAASKVTVTVGGGRLEIRYSPLPWPGVSISSDRIRKLYVERHRLYAVGEGRGIVSSKRRQLNRPTGGIYHTYQLRAMIRDSQDIMLLGGLNSMEEGLFLEQTLEEHLGIADHPVPGELP